MASKQHHHPASPLIGVSGACAGTAELLKIRLNKRFTLRDALTYGIHDSEHILRHVRLTNPSLRAHSCLELI